MNFGHLLIWSEIVRKMNTIFCVVWYGLECLSSIKIALNFNTHELAQLEQFLVRVRNFWTGCRCQRRRRMRRLPIVTSSCCGDRGVWRWRWRWPSQCYGQRWLLLEILKWSARSIWRLMVFIWVSSSTLDRSRGWRILLWKLYRIQIWWFLQSYLNVNIN